MASLVTRRQSIGSRPPRIVIPPRHSKDENEIQNEAHSPTLEVDLPEPTIVTPPLSGSFSPDLQPNTPPVIDRRNDRVLQIGKYLLVAQLDNNVYKAVDIHTNQEKVCKVSLQVEEHIIMRVLNFRECLVICALLDASMLPFSMLRICDVLIIF